LQRPIAIGYVLAEYSSVDTPIQFHMKYRNGRITKCMHATITQMPFVPTLYYRCQRPIDDETPPMSDINVEPLNFDVNDEDDVDEIEEMARRRKRQLLQLREPEYSTVAANILPEQVEEYHEGDDDDFFESIYGKDDEFLRYSSYFKDDDDNKGDRNPSVGDDDDDDIGDDNDEK
jgi:hypothetical protein